MMKNLRRAHKLSREDSGSYFCKDKKMSETSYYEHECTLQC